MLPGLMERLQSKEIEAVSIGEGRCPELIGTENLQKCHFCVGFYLFFSAI